MAEPPLLVLATTNRKKGLELAALVEPLGIQVCSLAEFPQALAVEEAGATFAENARLKATQQARHLGHWVLGEDSGLVVDALDGAPGVYSARFSGEGATDERNNELLIDRMSGVRDEARTARYVCFAAVADPSGTVRAETSGACEGRITRLARGTGGFGYDPYFEIVQYGKTFGELGTEVKAQLSHRAKAIKALAPALVELFVARP